MIGAAAVWDNAYALEVLPELLAAFVVTLQAVLGGTVIALVIGLALCVARRSPRRLLSWSTAGLVEMVRSTPLLVQLLFAYALISTMSPLAIGIAVLGLHYGCYISEVYRAGVDGVPRGQWEAARALNLTRTQTYRRVVLPQAIPPVLPALGNYVISMFKDTPMLLAITVVEVLGQAKVAGNRDFRYVEPLTLVAALYLVSSLLSSRGITWLERRAARVAR